MNSMYNVIYNFFGLNKEIFIFVNIVIQLLVISPKILNTGIHLLVILLKILNFN